MGSRQVLHVFTYTESDMKYVLQFLFITIISVVLLLAWFVVQVCYWVWYVRRPRLPFQDLMAELIIPWYLNLFG